MQSDCPDYSKESSLSTLTDASDSLSLDSTEIISILDANLKFSRFCWIFSKLSCSLMNRTLQLQENVALAEECSTLLHQKLAQLRPLDFESSFLLDILSRTEPHFRKQDYPLSCPSLKMDLWNLEEFDFQLQKLISTLNQNGYLNANGIPLLDLSDIPDSESLAYFQQYVIENAKIGQASPLSLTQVAESEWKRLSLLSNRIDFLESRDHFVTDYLQQIQSILSQYQKWIDAITIEIERITKISHELREKREASVQKMRSIDELLPRIEEESDYFSASEDFADLSLLDSDQNEELLCQLKPLMEPKKLKPPRKMHRKSLPALDTTKNYNVESKPHHRSRRSG
jgi:hypothetical protein